MGLARRLDLGDLARRVVFEGQRRVGWIERRLPTRDWDGHELQRWLRREASSRPEDYSVVHRNRPTDFFFKAEDRKVYSAHLRRILNPGSAALVAEADQIVEGKFRFFRATQVATGLPPDWFLNYATGVRYPSDRHWSKTPDLSNALGDIKQVWELSRFGHAYILARAYWLTSDERYPVAFWTLVESWRRGNPPQWGPNWKCPQEIGLRVMAWIFGLWAFGDSPATTPERVAMLAGMIGAHADRIAFELPSVCTQKNNHGISAAASLWTVGLLFDEFAAAPRWREIGRRTLERETRRQFYSDGAYVQHSFNYERVALHGCLWAVRLGELNGQPFSSSLKHRLELATEFLYALQNDSTGALPNYGSSDGALILPLSICEYDDFRPILRTAYTCLHRTNPYAPGPWDEEMLWLLGPSAFECVRSPRARRSLSARVGGYFALRGSSTSFGFTRCVKYKDRPHQADMLHFDLWWHGHNVACDPGTFSYNDTPPWNNGLVWTSLHNTVCVDGMDQMERGPRFMWFNWPRGTVRCHRRSPSGELEYFEGEHDGYVRNKRGSVVHRRAILRIGDDVWLICDDLMGRGRHTLRLHWLLPGVPSRVLLEAGQVILELGESQYGVWTGCPMHPFHLDVTKGHDTGNVRGWRSVRYGVRLPSISVAAQVEADLPCRFLTVFAPALGTQVMPLSNLGAVKIVQSSRSILISLNVPGQGFVISAVKSIEDQDVSQWHLDGEA